MRARPIRWTGVLLALALLACLESAFPHCAQTRAEEIVWRAVKTPRPAPAKATEVEERPLVTLGRPIPIFTPPEPGPVRSTSSSLIIRASAPEVGPPPPPGPPPSPLPGPPPGPPDFEPSVPMPRPRLTMGTLGDVAAEGIGSAEPVSADPPPLFPEAHNPSVAIDQPVRPGAWERFRGWFNFGDTSSCTPRQLLQSDHGFDNLISPIHMPFFFEDPRALTELRPIFLYQKIPGRNPVTRGGDAEFFGLQGRLALSERFSLVVSQLGFLSLNPDSRLILPSDTGFSEVQAGIKYTFLRNLNSGSIMAAGLNFQIPIGSSKVFQDTGNLALYPYLSYGHTFNLRGGYGSMNVLGNAGYSFALENKRSEFSHLGFHVDYNVANTGIYPLMELNWLYYTKGGKTRNVGFEGGDLINFGSREVGNRSQLDLTFGLRYKWTEAVQFGGGFSFPLLKNDRTLNDYRLTFDIILRY